MRTLLGIGLAALTLAFAACGSEATEASTPEACTRWDDMRLDPNLWRGTQEADSEAVAELNRIADLSEDAEVTRTANDLAGWIPSHKQPEYGDAYEALTSACEEARG